MKHGNVWTYGMYRQVLEEYPFKGNALAQEMGVAKATLQDKADKLGVSSVSVFTEEETRMLSMYGRTLGRAAMFLMPNHTSIEVDRALCELRRH